MDRERWGDPRSYLAEWVPRARIVAGYLEGCEAVADLGAGTQMLRPLLSCRYVPVDWVSLGPDTVPVDFDGEWSVSDLPAVDGVAIAGLLEHIKDPLGLIRKLRGYGKTWAVSYMDNRYHRQQNLVHTWELKRAFSDAGMQITASSVWSRQSVFRLVRA